MNDMSQVTAPKSDQINADDLLTGPRTITITDVIIRPGTEQPISIHYEGDNGKPYKACKSMCRVMVAAWGPDSKKYIGRSMTLYRDPSVKWGGMDVGGIRISHMSDIDSSLTLALTMTKSNRKPFTVKLIAKSIDWDAVIAKAATLEELAEVWKKIPAMEKQSHTVAKEARKQELQLSSVDPFVAEMEAAENSAPMV